MAYAAFLRTCSWWHPWYHFTFHILMSDWDNNEKPELHSKEQWHWYMFGARSAILKGCDVVETLESSTIPHTCLIVSWKWTPTLCSVTFTKPRCLKSDDRRLFKSTWMTRRHLPSTINLAVCPIVGYSIDLGGAKSPHSARRLPDETNVNLTIKLF